MTTFIRRPITGPTSPGTATKNKHRLARPWRNSGRTRRELATPPNLAGGVRPRLLKDHLPKRFKCPFSPLGALCKNPRFVLFFSKQSLCCFRYYMKHQHKCQKYSDDINDLRIGISSIHEHFLITKVSQDSKRTHSVYDALLNSDN